MEEKICVSCMEILVDFVIQCVRGSVQPIHSVLPDGSLYLDGFICEDCQHDEPMFMDLL